MPSAEGKAIAKILEKMGHLAACEQAVLKLLQSVENITLSQNRLSFQDNEATRHDVMQRLFPLSETGHNVTNAHDHP